MPKTIIHSRYYGHSADEARADNGHQSPTPVEATHLHIGWTKDGSEHVEVAVLNDLVKSSHPGDTAPGWFMQIDRHGINRAIRALRQARDDAFGRDE